LSLEPAKHYFVVKVPIDLFSHKQAQRKGDGVSSPCLKAGVFTPKI
jgi:hypothetical protein